MQWFSPVAEAGTSCGEAPLKLTVLVIYEDLRTGLRAMQMLDRTVHGLEATVDVEVNLWRVDLLREPALREQSGKEAAKADILFLSTHGKGELPATFSSWFEEWFRSRRGEPSALAVSLDADAKDTSGTPPEVEALGAEARRAGVDVFLHVGNTDLQSGQEDIHPRAKTNVMLAPGVAHETQWHPFRHWGINE